MSESSQQLAEHFEISDGMSESGCVSGDFREFNVRVCEVLEKKRQIRG
ncbi:hypothetical protein N9195_03065 [bacterium]|nr:hypothetical protein [bacterium]